MNNISNVKSCFGCGVCTLACGKKIIDIKLDKHGFYTPYITDPSKCTNCGLCKDVCSFCHTDIQSKEKPKISLGGWSKEESIREKCSSGGIGFEIGCNAIKKGYKVIAVRYNATEKRAEHYLAETIEELVSSIGSKYIQSYTLNGFKTINRKEKYLLIGTPCQIDSFRRYIQKFRCEDNFILIDFFCHGVPSKWIWDKYLNEIRKKLGNVNHVDWRNKQHGWHDSWNLVLKGEKGKCITSRWTRGDTFYQMFLGNQCLGKACYQHCKFKYNKSSADIRIGDMWGKTFANEEKGVTACIVYTDKGINILQDTKCNYKEYPFETVAEGQIQKKLKFPLGWSLIISLAKSTMISMNVLVFINKIIRKINIATNGK